MDFNDNNNEAHEEMQKGFFAMRQVFVDLTAVGFTEAQALEVVIRLILNAGIK